MGSEIQAGGNPRFSSSAQDGRAALDRGDASVAEPLLRAAILDDPGDATLRADLGLALERQGRFADAKAAYAAAAALEPDSPVYHFNQGAAAQAAGESHIAAGHYLDALEREPLFAEAYYNLATLFFEAGHYAIAAEHYENALKARPVYAEAVSNLGLCYRQTGRTEEAIALFRKALSLRPDLAITHANLGIALSEAGLFEEAIACYGRAISFDPTNPNMHINLSLAWRGQGRVDLAAESALKALGLDPSLPPAQLEAGSVAAALHRQGCIDELDAFAARWRALSGESNIFRHAMASLGRSPIPLRADDAYVAQMFDASAKRFDEMIASLGYQAPRLIGEALARHCGEPAGCLDIADAGCGTGLAAPVLRPFARSLIGADLSAAMLEQARRRGLYDALAQTELTLWLAERPAAYDAIIFGDVLCYFGDLTPALRKTADALRSGGLAILTVEVASGAAPFTLGVSGRYAHHPVHVQESLVAAGLMPLELTPAVLRHESGQPVEGLLAVARKP
jgi:predicted TPR repeat methyltransferase